MVSVGRGVYIGQISRVEKLTNVTWIDNRVVKLSVSKSRLFFFIFIENVELCCLISLCERNERGVSFYIGQNSRIKKLTTVIWTDNKTLELRN